MFQDLEAHFEDLRVGGEAIGGARIMKSSTRLDSVVFQLTPTRTRYSYMVITIIILKNVVFIWLIFHVLVFYNDLLLCLYGC